MAEKLMTDGSMALREKQYRVITIEATEKPQNAKLRVAAYARVSSASDDQLNSFAAQNRHYSDLISSKENWRMVDIYADEGITGTSAEKREDFQRLLADCRRGLIDRVLVKSISRFARNTKECLETIRELKSLGVGVYFEKENIDTATMSGEIMTALFASFAQAESESISGNMRWGIQKRMQAGTYIPANLPYGYTLQDHSIRIVEEQAVIVQRMYEDTPELLALAMEISWTQNVVILEADMEPDERRWYLRAAGRFGWSKVELQRKIDSDAHLEIQLDESEVPCYTECDSNELECTEHDQDTFSLPRQYLQKPDGRVYHEGSGEESRSGAEHSNRVGGYQHRGDRQSGVSASPPQAVRAWHRLFRQTSPATSEQRLREVRPSDWHGSSQPAEYVPDLRRRFCRQDAPADGLYQPSRRGGRSVVHRRFRHDLAGCGGRLPGIAPKNNQQRGSDERTSWLSRERKLVYNGIPSEMTLSA